MVTYLLFIVFVVALLFVSCGVLIDMFRANKDKNEQQRINDISYLDNLSFIPNDYRFNEKGKAMFIVTKGFDYIEVEFSVGVNRNYRKVSNYKQAKSTILQLIENDKYIKRQKAAQRIKDQERENFKPIILKSSDNYTIVPKCDDYDDLISKMVNAHEINDYKLEHEIMEELISKGHIKVN